MQETSPHFEKAPIVEAIIGIELQDKLSDSHSVALSILIKSLEGDYPSVETSSIAQSLPDGNQDDTSETAYYLKSADGERVAYLHRKGFAFSQLAPYTRWEDFRAEARRLWSAYRREVGLVSLSKFFVRYLNRLDIPNNSELESYLNFYPQVPPELPQTVSRCFMQVVYPLREPCQGSFTQRLSPTLNENPGSASFILDHDFVYSAEGLSEQEVWQSIEQCRGIKNRFFLASVTDKMKESFR